MAWFLMIWISLFLLSYNIVEIFIAKKSIIEPCLFSPEVNKHYFCYIHKWILPKVPIFYLNGPKRPIHICYVRHLFALGEYRFELNTKFKTQIEYFVPITYKLFLRPYTQWIRGCARCWSRPRFTSAVHIALSVQ